MKSKIDLIALGVPHSQSSTRGANISFGFRWFYFTGATDFADKEGLLFAGDEGLTLFIIFFLNRFNVSWVVQIFRILFPVSTTTTTFFGSFAEVEIMPVTCL